MNFHVGSFPALWQLELFRINLYYINLCKQVIRRIESGKYCNRFVIPLQWCGTFFSITELSCPLSCKRSRHLFPRTAVTFDSITMVNLSFYRQSSHVTHVRRKQTLRSLSLSYQKKDRRMATPILLLVWHRLFRRMWCKFYVFSKSRSHAKRRMDKATCVNPSFGMTTTKTHKVCFLVMCVRQSSVAILPRTSAFVDHWYDWVQHFILFPFYAHRLHSYSNGK